MTSSRRHNRAPLRRSSTPEKILASGLAAAVCIGIVGVIGVRTMDSSDDQSADDTTTGTTSAVSDPAPVDVAPADQTTQAAQKVVVSKDGLTREQLDAYAAALAAEKHRLDVYRVKLIRAAKRLQAVAGVGASTVQAGTVDSGTYADQTTSTTPTTTAPAKPATQSSSTPSSATKPPASKPAASKPAAQPVAAQPAAAKPAQSSTKSS